MKITENELENRLRQAPSPQPTGNLRQRLIDNITLTSENEQAPSRTITRQTWLPTWKPMFAAAAIMAACLATLGVQQSKIAKLRQSIATMEQKAQLAKETQKSQASQSSSGNATLGASLASSRAELDDLPKTIEKLKAEINTLENLRVENAKLRAQLSSYSGLTEEETKGLQLAKERADRIKCVNNLKNLGLAARVYATDNNDVFPPDILSMTNEMGSTKILVCPSDTQHTAAANWQEFGPANLSYEYLAPSGNFLEPNQVMFRCSIHNNICLTDGSVQQINGTSTRLVQRDGKLYFGDPPQLAPTRNLPAGNLPAGNLPAGAGMSDAMRKRYGLPPAETDPSKPTEQ